MRKFITYILCSFMTFSLIGCGNNESQTETEESTAIVEESEIVEEEEYVPIEEKVHTIRINGVNYYDTNRTVSSIEEATEDTITGEIKSFVSRDEFPNEDNQSNFGVGYTYQIKNEDFAYLNINGEWHLFCSNEDGKNVITFNDRVFLKTELSAETLEWLEKYNELSEDEKLATSSIPAELIDEVIFDVEDAEIEAKDTQENNETEVEVETKTGTKSENGTSTESVETEEKIE